jgi:antitoxin component YwqK of YwqJK toxin-antitoxin module
MSSETNKIIFNDLETYPNGNIKKRIYESNDLWVYEKDKVRLIIVFYENGNIKYEYWNKNFIKHREYDLPAILTYYENGNIKSEKWCYNGFITRLCDKPSIIDYYENGNIKYEVYMDTNNTTRDNDLPSYIEYYENRNIDGMSLIKYKKWYKHNELHRYDKPAIIFYDEQGKIYTEEYYKYGELYFK